MGGAFSKSSGSSSSKKGRKPPGGTISSVDRAVLDLKNSRDRLQRYKQKLELDQAKLLERARECKSEKGNSKLALLLLKLRKQKLLEAQNVDDQLLNVLQMVQTIHTKQEEAAVLEALAAGKDALQHMHAQRSIDDVMNLMDAIQEENQVEQEINDILQETGSAMGVGDDDAEIEAELEKMEQALLLEEEGKTTTTTEEEAQTTPIELPQVPTDKLPTPAEVATAAGAGKSEAVPEKRVAVAS